MSVKTLGRELDAAHREVDQEKREMADLNQAKELLVSKVRGWTVAVTHCGA